MLIGSSHNLEYRLLKERKPCMAYDGCKPFAAWQQEARRKLAELLGLPERQEAGVHFTPEHSIDCGDFTDHRFLLETEPGYLAPCHLLIPKGKSGKIPLTVCLMGHGGGMHVAIGRVKRPADEETIKSWPHRAMGLRAIADGRCALIVEPRSFGETSDEGYGVSCMEAAKIAILNGRTLLGGRVWDNMCALDAVAAHFPQVSMEGVAATGNSGGGTITYYLACLDERIALAAPSCSVCTFEDSIAAMPHCLCNHVPGIRKYFEMGDMAGMIAPRALIVAAGQYDRDFPIHGVRKAYQQIEAVYRAAGAPDRCSLVVGEQGHLNYADLIWQEAVDKHYV